MLPDIGRSFGVAANVIALLPMLTQIGYALGLFFLKPDATAPYARSVVFPAWFWTAAATTVVYVRTASHF